MSAAGTSSKSKEYGPADAAAAVWRLPSPTSSILDVWKRAYPLQVYNSLTRSKVPFIPMRGRQVLWYMCGPTVYDSAHMGHARTYVSFDVLRRIMTDVFGYDVKLTMNITDIDDKIIKRSCEASIEFAELARKYEREFLGDMARLGVAPPDVMTRVSEYVPEIVAYIQGIIDRGYAYESGGSVYFSVASFTAAGKDKSGKTAGGAAGGAAAAAGKGKGGAAAAGGAAAGGSSAAAATAPLPVCSHTYAKLVPENAGNKEALEEGEGVLTASAGARDKRDQCDFALWKASKPGEPAWDSPWGRGRPGWHIECSAMCHSTLGDAAGGAIDIHSGGVDLRFPHHDNEIAQSEAFLEHNQWVNYFLHTGHLNIDGLKMAKTLKNFIKINDGIGRYGARAMRMLFLLYKYNAPMDYSESVMELVASIEKPIAEFFGNVKAALRSLSVDGRAKWGGREHEFSGVLEATKEAVRAALADDFDTPAAMDAIRALIKDCNKYMAGQALSSTSDPVEAGWRPVPYLLRAAADYVTHMFRVFGLVDPMPAIGFDMSFSADAAGAADDAAGAGSAGGAGAGASKEAILAPYLDVLASFRETVRDAARAKDTGKVLTACDVLRDALLPPLGVVLEDGVRATAPAAAGGAGDAAAAGAGSAAGTSAWKLRDPAELRREAEEKKRKEADKAAEKAALEAARLKKEADKLAAASVPPADMFRGQTDKYSAFDGDGVPTTGADGVALGEKAVKKLRKDWEKQKTAYEWYLSKTGGAPAAAAAGTGAASGGAGAAAAAPAPAADE